MDYRKTAQEILDKVGGGKNIVSAAHCATRLRLVIADNSKADKTAIENVEGVKDLIRICTVAEGRCVARPECLSVGIFCSGWECRTAKSIQIEQLKTAGNTVLHSRGKCS